MDALEVELKHYNRYIKKLTMLSNLLGLEVIFRTVDCDGYFSSAKSVIVIDPAMGQSNTVAVFLHELGHAFQFYFGSHHAGNKLERAYNKSRKVVTEHDLQLIVSYEAEAWDYGADIAKALNIKTGKWFPATKRIYLDYYRKNYKK